MQYISIKKVTPLCRQRNDSVKKSDNIKSENAICTKLLLLIAFLKEINNMVNNKSSPKIPNSANI